MREEILELMEFYDGNNIIINDYIENLKNIQANRENFKNIDLKNEILSWNEIHGFYNALDKEFEKGILPMGVNFAWEYVPNPRGGFMSYFFPALLSFKTFSIYSQIKASSGNNNESKLFLGKEKLKYVIKIHSSNKNSKLLYPIYDIIKNN